MALQFQSPPDWLLQAYVNRKSPTQVAAEGIQGVLGTYATLDNQQKTNEITQQTKDIEMAKGMAANGQDFMDAYKQIVAARTPATKIPFSTLRAPTALGGELNPDTVNPSANVSPIIAHFNSLNPQLASIAQSPSISGYQSPPVAGMEPPVQSTGPMAGVPTMTTNVATDPLVKEYQKDPLAFKKQHGANGMTKLKTQAELDKLITEKENTPYYDAKGNKLFDLPPGGKLIPGTVSATGKTFIGNDADGNPLFADKGGIITPGNVPGGGPILPKTSTMPTSSTRSSAEFADTIIPHIQSMRNLIQEADKKGFIGPAAGRVYGQFMAGKIGSTGNPVADKLLGQLRATDSLLKTGAMRVHFGAKGGQQMYDHFSELLNSGKQSAALMNGSLDAMESFMQGYSDAGKPGGRARSGNATSGNRANAPGDPLGIR